MALVAQLFHSRTKLFGACTSDRGASSAQISQLFGKFGRMTVYGRLGWRVCSQVARNKRGILQFPQRPHSTSPAKGPDAHPVWSLGKLNHVAIATPDLEAASAMYRNILGARVSEATPLPEHGVYTVFVELPNSKIELLHPLGKNSPIQGFLDKNKSGGIHHICIEVNDIEAALKTLKEKNLRILGDGGTKIGAHGKPVVFLHPKDCGGVLVELEQA